MSMFRVTPVPESSKERKVSFSPDIDESYRHEVVGKIKNLMEEVSVSFFSIFSYHRIFFPSFLLEFFRPILRLVRPWSLGLGHVIKIQHLLRLKTTVDFQHKSDRKSDHKSHRTLAPGRNNNNKYFF